MLFRNPDYLALLALLPLMVAVWLLRRGRVPGSALALRLLIVGLLALALADPLLPGAAPSQALLVLAVDQSDSLGEAGKAALRDRANRLARAHAGPVQVIYFGADVAAEAANPAAAGRPRPDGSDIAGALRAARGMLGPAGGRVVLLSDGLQTEGDALAEARALAAAGVPVDTVSYQAPGRPEVWAEAIEAPRTLREGEQFTVTIVVRSTAAAEATLELVAGDRPLLSQQVQLAPGENRFPYTNTAGRAGVLGLRASVTARPDTLARNNSAAATVLVAPAPRVLLVAEQSRQATTLRGALRDAGVLAELLEPTALPAQLSALEAYEAVVLVDVPAGAFTLDQMAALREFVRSEGRGLLATGGRSSFTLGAYKDTPLEEVLPVAMTPPPRPERADVTLLLIIDQSASMGPETGTSKFNMAKEAAILATESLNEEDRIGVLAFDVSQSWAVEFQRLGSGLGLAEVQSRIGTLPLGGGTDIYGALEVGLPALAAQPGQVRHAVLLTDGRSFTDERDLYRALIDEARARNITLSAIAIGSDADTELLSQLAQWGAGRYHFAETPEDIPRLTLLESEIARTEPQVEGVFRAEQAQPHPVLRSYAPDQLPQLGGYVATSLKPEAELVLQSPEGDPVLATWQYGLGRAVAWTPGVEAPWAPDWSNWPEYGQFWASIIRYTLPEPDSGPLQVRVTPNGDTVTVTADAVAPSGEPLDLADTEATITLPDGTARQIVLAQSAPGRYTQEVALPADGPYAVEVRQRTSRQERSASAGYVQRYPAEYVPPADESAARAGPELLAAISTAT
ncbi:MAG TPA: VWA domain-containing protein, partial [Roseiflexaceae bacterium]|nr:VWA domain-containing protein [Roseiflexaceae bacterium]